MPITAFASGCVYRHMDGIEILSAALAAIPIEASIPIATLVLIAALKQRFVRCGDPPYQAITLGER
jgi:hypothetical protein